MSDTYRISEQDPAEAAQQDSRAALRDAWERYPRRAGRAFPFAGRKRGGVLDPLACELFDWMLSQFDRAYVVRVAREGWGLTD